jgi:hypothetical protein
MELPTGGGIFFVDILNGMMIFPFFLHIMALRE